MNLQRGPVLDGKDRQQAVDSVPYATTPVMARPQPWLQGDATWTWYASVGLVTASPAALPVVQPLVSHPR
jgi:hypothetical protein